MDRADMLAFAKGTLEKAVNLLEIKADEYERKGFDSNFNRAAALAHSTPERALCGMMAKHIVSIYDMVDDLDNHRNHDFPQWSEKCLDIINYLLLLLAMQKEKSKWNFNQVEYVFWDEEKASGPSL